MEFGADFDEVFKEDLATVVRLRSLFQLLNEDSPVTSNFVEDLSEQLNGLVLVHFLMQRAVVGVTLGGLPALFMLAAVNAQSSWLVLSEVKSFCGMDFTSNSQLEVFVRNLPVFVEVKLVENHLELFVVDFQTPVLEVETQLVRTN